MKRAIVVGCNGFIGQRLVQYLVEQNVFVIGIDVEKRKNDSKNFVFRKLSFSDEMIKELGNDPYDVVYHLSWIGVSSIEKNNYNAQLKNINLTYDVLRLCSKIHVNKIIIPGSASEFSKNKGPIDGLGDSSPSDLYAATKVEIRKLSFKFCEEHKMNLNWLLITSVYGPGRKDANLITSCVEHIKKNKEFNTTKLEQLWDYIYIDDLIEVLFLVGEKGKSNKIYPVGSGEVHKLKYYVECIYKTMHSKMKPNIGAIPYKNAYIDNSIIDTNAIKKDLGFEPKYKFERGIIEYINSLF